MQQILGFWTSPQQKRLWRLENDSHVYRAQSAVLIEGELNKAQLRDALRQVTSRHQALRTRYHYDEMMGMPVQIIDDETTLPWQMIDIEGVGAERLSDELNLICAQQSSAPFALSEGSLARLCLVHLSPSKEVLIITMHALIADDTTLTNLSHEIRACYQACSSGESLSDDLVQYVHFSEWQNEILEDADSERKEFWRARLGAGSLALRLPFEKDQAGRFDPQVIELSFDDELAGRIDQTARDYKATAADFLLACWHTLLWKTTGEADIIVGYEADGRKYEEMNGAFGLFAKWLPVGSNFQPHFKFSKILRNTARSVADGLQWDEYFVLDDMTAREGGQSYFAAGFQYQQMTAAHSLDGLTFSTLKQCAIIEPFKIKLACRRRGAALVGELHYDRRLISEEWARVIGERLISLVNHVVKNPETEVGGIKMIGPGERQAILCRINQTAEAFDMDSRLHRLIAEQARQTPDRTAVIYEGKESSYDELNRRANQLAHYLRRRGAGADDLVGLCVERSSEMVIAVLGVLKAGAAYVALDPTYPQKRLEYMLEDSCAKILITQSHLVGRVEGLNRITICLDKDWEKIEQESDEDPVEVAEPESTAYVIYTSGSTGRPKGVLISHGAICNHMLWMAREFPLNEADRVLQKTPISFDASVWEFYLPLMTGATLVVARPGGHQDTDYLVEAIDKNHVTILQLVPTMLKALIEHGGISRSKSLRRLFCGGEALSPELVRQWKAIHPAPIFNLYGPTEASIDATFWGCLQETGSESVSIGRPIANTRVYVLDERLEIVPLGMPGELCIGGEGLARCYHNRPDLTAERFISDPFGDKVGARLYRTGDMVRLHIDQKLEYLGRMDEQVKIRGYRIEIGEIEAALKQHEAIKDSVVIVQDDGSRDKRLVGFIITEAPHPDGDEVRSHLGRLLPDYMIPAHFVSLERLPLMPNGKIDRAALRATDIEARAGMTPKAKARTMIEQVLAGIWAELLKIDEVGINDNFFDLGGHSLLATQVISRIRDVFNCELRLGTVFEASTVALLAKVIERTARQTGDESDADIKRVERTEELPLSYAQQRLWFLHRLDPHSPAFNMASSLRLSGPLDLPALRRTLNEVVRRHEVLRTIFPLVASEPVQSIQQPDSIRLEEVDLSPMREEAEAEARREARREIEKPFDLERGPVMRAKVIKLSEEEHVLVAVMHHIVSDGWSMGVVTREVGEIYESYRRGEEARLEEMEVQYVDYAVWQREYLKGEVLDSQLDYWRQQLGEDPPVLELPLDRPRPKSQTFMGGYENFLLPEETSSKLRELSRKHGVTTYMTLLAAFYVLLQRYSDQDDIVVGSNLAGRNRSEIENLVGPFINPLPLRVDLSEDPTFVELLRRVRKVCLGAHAHQDIPFDMLIEMLLPGRNSGHAPIFQVLFGLFNVAPTGLELANITVSGFPVRSEVTNFDLQLNVTDTGRSLICQMPYSLDVFDADTIKRMADQYQVLLADIIRNPLKEVSALEVACNEEIEQLSEAFNQ